MGTAANLTRDHRPLTSQFQHDTTDVQRLGDGKAWVEWGRAFILARGVQLTQKTTCRGGGWLPRHSPDVRVRLGGLTIWRVQGTPCPAVVTVLPPFVWRHRPMRPAGARQARWATHGGRRVERCAVIGPRALGRCGGPAASGHGAHPGWSVPAHVGPGRCTA